jgi:hypothetical protein
LFSRTSAKAVADVLSERIQYLEKLIKEQSARSPLSNEAERAAAVISSAIDMSPENHGQPPPYIEPDEAPSVAMSAVSYAEGSQTAQSGCETTQASLVVGKLIPSPIRFDMASGRVRYVSPAKALVFSYMKVSAALLRGCFPLVDRAKDDQIIGISALQQV